MPLTQKSRHTRLIAACSMRKENFLRKEREREREKQKKKSE
jgi:hypothetical protein